MTPGAKIVGAGRTTASDALAAPARNAPDKYGVTGCVHALTQSITLTANSPVTARNAPEFIALYLCIYSARSRRSRYADRVHFDADEPSAHGLMPCHLVTEFYQEMPSDHLLEN
jgi:hypothetical protein